MMACNTNRTNMMDKSMLQQYHQKANQAPDLRSGLVVPHSQVSDYWRNHAGSESSIWVKLAHNTFANGWFFWSTTRLTPNYLLRMIEIIAKIWSCEWPAGWYTPIDGWSDSYRFLLLTMDSQWPNWVSCEGSAKKSSSMSARERSIHPSAGPQHGMAGKTSRFGAWHMFLGSCRGYAILLHLFIR